MAAKILFVCTQGRHRSRTAAEVAGRVLPGVTTRFAGVLNDADVVVTEDDIEWCDLLVCMEKFHRNRLRRRFHGFYRKVRVWHLPDEFAYADPVLVSLVKEKLAMLK